MFAWCGIVARGAKCLCRPEFRLVARARTDFSRTTAFTLADSPETRVPGLLQNRRAREPSPLPGCREGAMPSPQVGFQKHPTSGSDRDAVYNFVRCEGRLFRLGGGCIWPDETCFPRGVTTWRAWSHGTMRLSQVMTIRPWRPIPQASGGWMTRRRVFSCLDLGREPTSGKPTATHSCSRRIRVGRRVASRNPGLEAHTTNGRPHGLPASPGTPLLSPAGAVPVPEGSMGPAIPHWRRRGPYPNELHTR